MEVGPVIEKDLEELLCTLGELFDLLVLICHLLGKDEVLFS